MSGLDALRSRLLVRASVRLDRELAGRSCDSTLARPELGTQGIAKQALREFDVLRQTLTGPAMHRPVRCAMGPDLHPARGGHPPVDRPARRSSGVAISIFLAWRNESATNHRLKQANDGRRASLCRL